MMQLAAFSDWVVTAANFVWRQTGPAPPILEAEPRGSIGGHPHFAVTVRNSDAGHSIDIESIRVEPNAAIDCISHASEKCRIPPGGVETLVYAIDSVCQVERVTCAIRSGQRARRYSAKL